MSRRGWPPATIELHAPDATWWSEYLQPSKDKRYHSRLETKIEAGELTLTQYSVSPEGAEVDHQWRYSVTPCEVVDAELANYPVEPDGPTNP